MLNSELDMPIHPTPTCINSRRTRLHPAVALLVNLQLLQKIELSPLQHKRSVSKIVRS